MLVNVKFYKIFTIFILLSVNLSADEKNQIVTQLNNLNSLEFTFDQTIIIVWSKVNSNEFKLFNWVTIWFFSSAERFTDNKINIVKIL